MTACPKPTKRIKEKKKAKKKSLPQLIKKADAVTSRFVLNRDKVDLNGMCCTCSVRPATQAGHFVRRIHKKIRYHPHNVHGQCSYCNFYLDGNEAEYARFIINKYGMEEFNWLLSQKGTYKPSREELEKIIEAYS